MHAAVECGTNCYLNQQIRKNLDNLVGKSWKITSKYCNCFLVMYVMITARKKNSLRSNYPLPRGEHRLPGVGRPSLPEGEALRTGQRSTAHPLVWIIVLTQNLRARWNIALHLGFCLDQLILFGLIRSQKFKGTWENAVTGASQKNASRILRGWGGGWGGGLYI